MRKLFRTLLLLVLFAPFAMQADEIIVGNGTDAANIAPFGNAYGYSWVEMVYPNSMIGQTCTITSLSYNCTAIGTTTTHTTNEINIYLAESTKTTMTAGNFTPEADLTLVYSGSDVTIGDEEWETFVLNTPFEYSGENSLIVVFSNNNGGLTNVYTKWACSTISNSIMFDFHDTNSIGAQFPSSECAMGGSGYVYSKLPNVKLGTNNDETPDPEPEEPEQGESIDFIIGAEGTTASANIPTYEYYNYSISQQIYTADEMQFTDGTISSVAFKQYDTNVKTRNLAIYLVNTNKSEFVSNTDWLSVPTENLVFSGEVTYPGVAGEWLEFELQTPFEYTGNNLMVCVLDNTGSYVNAANFYTYDTDTTRRALYAYRDNNIFYPTNPSVSGNFSLDWATGNGYNSVVEFGVENATTETTVVLSDDFNDGELSGWRVIDADDDGYNWSISDGTSYPGNNESGCIYSESYIGPVLYPDNYIVTTEKYAITENSVFSWKVKPLDYYYYTDHYAFIVSSDNANWTIVWEETLEAFDSYMDRSVDMSEYAGQSLYIGFRHYDCDGNNGTAVCIDDVVLTGSGSTPENPDETIYNPVKYITATEVDETSVEVTWSMYDYYSKENKTVDTPAFSSYNLYKKNIFTNEIELLLEKTNDTAYVDYAWATDEAGVYQWGATAIYTANKNRGRKMVELLNEGFETGYNVIPEGWTTYSEPSTANTYSNFGVTESLYNLYYPCTGTYSAFHMGAYSDNGSLFYFVSPAIDMTAIVNPTISFNYVCPVWAGAYNNMYVKYSESPTGPWTTLWEGTSNDAWVEATADLSECSGKTIYIAFCALENGAWGAGIDDVVVTSKVTDGPIPETSEILWSNPIDKDMTTSVTVYAMTDNGDPVDGTVVSFVNLTEEGISYEATLDETGFVTIEDFRKGTYELNISKDGYYSSVENEVVEIWEATDFEVFLTEILATVEDLYVSPTGWAMWKSKNDRALESYTVMLDGYIEAEGLTVPYYQHENLIDGAEYTTTIIANYTMGESEEMSYTWVKASEDIFSPVTDLAAINEDGITTLTWNLPVYKNTNPIVYEFSSDFNDGSLEGWINIDANNDGFTWMNTAEFANQGFGVDDTHCAVSESYSMSTGSAITPDNYLITDKKYTITESSILTYSISAHDRAYDEEHYGVAISTTGTNPEDFVVIFEETLSAGEADYDGDMDGQWYNIEIDLSAYAGQQIYIAFRHFDCYNMAWLKLDNVELTNSSKRIEDGQWLQYHNGINESALGFMKEIGGPGISFNWAIMFPTDIVSEYAGTSLTKISVYVYEGHHGEFSIHFGGDDAPDTTVHTQSYDLSSYSYQIVELELTNPIQISGTENVWIQFSNTTGTYVASYTADCGDPNSRWISDDGGLSWYDASYYGEGWYGSWQIGAYIEGETTSTPDEPENAIAEVLGVMIYKNGELLNSTPITSNSYTDINGQVGDEYCVKVVYGGELDYTYYAMSEAECVVAAPSEITQSTALASGWNWYSSYIDVEGTEGLELMKEALGTSATQIKNQTAFVDYTSIWFGTLTATNLEEMYMIKMNSALNMETTGPQANPTDHPITLGTNWKWIGYPVNGTMSVNEAFSNITPNSGDYVKSQFGFAQYLEGLGWTGTLNTMTPGQGYMYQNTSGTVKTLVYPEANAKSELDANITSENNHWVPNSTKYPTNMTMIAVVEGMKDYEVAAFCNGEVRGSARPIYVEELDSYMLFLTIYGEENDEITFRYFDLNTEEETELLDVMNYGVNATIGNVMNPHVLNFATLNVDEMSSNLSIYPNPVEKGGKVYFGTTCEKVEIYNTLGVKIYEYENVNSIEGIETSGVYVVKAINNGNVSYSRVIVE